ncbi:NAD-dependent dehydratase [Erwinia sp. OLMDLW33]|nr:NAD-dependent dehydratase [Erwinia sp. OLMDLW33]
MKLLLLGATGLVGSHVLELALASSAVGAVIAPTRKPLPLYSGSRANLINMLIDFDSPDLNDPLWRVDAVICALGTTIRQAGSREAFRQVDYDYPLTFARLAKMQGANVFALTSATGADPSSRFFYNRVKGELEEALVRERFTSLTLVRPGVIGGARTEVRPAETALKLGLTLFAPLLPRCWQLNPAAEIAERLLKSVLTASPGVSIVSAGEMTGKR